jgi:hypothetical protein
MSTTVASTKTEYIVYAAVADDQHVDGDEDDLVVHVNPPFFLATNSKDSDNSDDFDEET